VPRLRAPCRREPGIRTFRQIGQPGVTLSPAGGLHLSLLPLFGTLIGGEMALAVQNTISMHLRPYCAGRATTVR
jgi:hypothetical protein